MNNVYKNCSCTHCGCADNCGCTSNCVGKGCCGSCGCESQATGEPSIRNPIEANETNLKTAPGGEPGKISDTPLEQRSDMNWYGDEVGK